MIRNFTDFPVVSTMEEQKYIPSCVKSRMCSINRHLHCMGFIITDKTLSIPSENVNENIEELTFKL